MPYSNKHRLQPEIEHLVVVANKIGLGRLNVLDTFDPPLLWKICRGFRQRERKMRRWDLETKQKTFAIRKLKRETRQRAARSLQGPAKHARLSPQSECGSSGRSHGFPAHAPAG